MKYVLSSTLTHINHTPSSTEINLQLFVRCWVAPSGHDLLPQVAYERSLRPHITADPPMSPHLINELSYLKFESRSGSVQGLICGG
jgi:hypothetical protein